MGMPDHDKRDLLVAFDKAPGKRGSAELPNLNVCGDIGLKIGRDGTWFYQGSPIERKPLVKLFASVLRRESDGGYFLVTPVEKVSIEVEGLPFVAVAMGRESSGRTQVLTFRTNVDDEVAAGRDHPLGVLPAPDGGIVPFVLVRDGLKARLARPVYYELAALATEADEADEAAGPGVWSCGAFFPFAEAPPAM
jgi:hypothetical protein